MASRLERRQAEYLAAILEGMARTLWLTSYADWADAHRDGDASGIERPGPGGDWDDVAPETPQAAVQAASDLEDLYIAANDMGLADLFALAIATDRGEGDFDWPRITDNANLGLVRERLEWSAVAADFGHGLAMMALGTGISWFDDHKEFPLGRVHFECHLETTELTWSGGSSDNVELEGAYEGSFGNLTNINAGDRHWTRHRYVLWFGAYGDTRLLVHANSLDDALDEAIDWIVDHEPGLLADSAVEEEYQRLRAEGMDQHEAMETAEQDTTSGGNAGNRINSHEWGIVAEDPTDVQLRDLGGVPAVTRPRLNHASR
jgi:hypothetical protein